MSSPEQGLPTGTKLPTRAKLSHWSKPTQRTLSLTPPDQRLPTGASLPTRPKAPHWSKHPHQTISPNWSKSPHQSNEILRTSETVKTWPVTRWTCCLKDYDLWCFKEDDIFFQSFTKNGYHEIPHARFILLGFVFKEAC